MPILSELHLLRPWWLLALVPLGLLLVTLWRRRLGESIWLKLVDPHLLPHLLVGERGTPRRSPLLLLGVGWLLLVLALAGPAWERLQQPVFSTGAQRVILLDLSPSMNAADVAPSRLARARFEILDLLRASTEGQVALIAFGPEPFVVSPLTGDARTIAAQVPQLTTDLIPVPGPRRTELALRSASEMLDRAAGRGGELILVTDQLDDPAASLAMAQGLASLGRRLHVLVVGTEEGAPVPDPKGGFVKDGAGGIRIARRDSQPLRELARAGGGSYLEAEVGDRDTRTLVAGGLELADRVEETTLAADQWREEGPWLLLILLPLAALGFRRGWLLPVAALALVLPPGSSLAVGWPDLWARQDQQAARQLAAGDAQGAAERFRDPAWRAAASYRAGDFEAALAALAGSRGLDADYNRGNALARLGRLEEAAEAYERVLAQDPNQSDARHNLDLVRALLEQQDSSGSGPSSPDGSTAEAAGQPEKGGEGDADGQNADEQPQPPPRESRESQAGEEGSGRGRGQAGAGSPESGGEEAEQTPAPSGPTEAGTPPGDLAAGESGAGAPPGASDLGPEPLESGPDPAWPETADTAGTESSGRRPEATSDPEGRAADGLTPREREQQAALEAQLRRVPDDPAGLLRQRFLLQHLRREGRLP